MNIDQLPDNPYLLLTPGPLSTTKTVKAAMLRDWCTWDDDFNSLVQDIRERLTGLATSQSDRYTTVLMQGSGTFSVESVIGSVIPPTGKLLVLANGAYGRRIGEIAARLKIATRVNDSGDTAWPDLDELQRCLDDDWGITHVAVVHSETTTGLLNPVESIGPIVKQAGRVFIVDAMSSFGGIPLDVNTIGIDFLISSANKCIQGVPGFGFVIARKAELDQCRGWSRSLALDLYDQWRTMEEHCGKWRFTAPTHTVRAFHQALVELDAEGGVDIRHSRYRLNQLTLVNGMKVIGFTPLLKPPLQSPIITTFYYPHSAGFDFQHFYQLLKARGFVIYPGKLTGADVFRIGNIGDVTLEDINRLLSAIKESRYWL